MLAYDPLSVYSSRTDYISCLKIPGSGSGEPDSGIEPEVTQARARSIGLVLTRVGPSLCQGTDFETQPHRLPH